MKEIGKQGIKIKSIVLSKELQETQKFMPIGKDDLERLEKSIRKEGVRDPIKVYRKDGNFHLLAGLNRLSIFTKIAKEKDPVNFGNEEIEAIVFEGSSKDFTDFTINDNLERRHFSREEKTALINYFIKADPSASDRSIAKKTKTDNKTVAAKRNEMKAREEIPHVEKKDSLGRRVGIKSEIKLDPNKKVIEARLKKIDSEIAKLELEKQYLTKQLKRIK